MIMKFKTQGDANGVLAERRKQQTLSWVYAMVEEHLHNLFYRAPEIIACRTSLEDAVIGGKISATMAVQKFVTEFAKARARGEAAELSPFEIQ